MKHTRRQFLAATACGVVFATVPALSQTAMLSGTSVGPQAFLGDPNARFDTIDTSGGITFSTLPFSYDDRNSDSRPRISAQIPAFIQVSAMAINATGKVVSPDGSSIITGAALRPYERLEYQWDFGDPSGTEIFNNYSVYPFTGIPVNANNQQWGPEACYVYRKPGTYTITLNIRGRNSTGTGYITNTVTRKFTALANSRTRAFDTDSPPFTGGLATGTQTITNPSSTANITVGTTLTLVSSLTGQAVDSYLAPGTYVSQIGPTLHVRTQAPGYLDGAILQGLTSAQMIENNWAIVPSNDFYFDSVNGDDANGGNTPATPKKGYDISNVTVLAAARPDETIAPVVMTLTSEIAKIFTHVKSKVAFHLAYGSNWKESSASAGGPLNPRGVSHVRFGSYQNKITPNGSNNAQIVVGGLAKHPPCLVQGTANAITQDIVFSNIDFIVDSDFATPNTVATVSCFMGRRGPGNIVSDIYCDHCNFLNKSHGMHGAWGMYMGDNGTFDPKSQAQNFAVWGGKVTCAVYATYTDFMAYGSGDTLTVTQIKSYRGDPNNGNVPFNIAKPISPITSAAQRIGDHSALPGGTSFASGTTIVPPITNNGDGTWTVTLSRAMTGSIPSNAPVNIWSYYGGAAVISFGAMQWQTFMGIQESDNGGQGNQYSPHHEPRDCGQSPSCTLDSDTRRSRLEQHYSKLDGGI